MSVFSVSTNWWACPIACEGEGGSISSAGDRIGPLGYDEICGNGGIDGAEETDQTREGAAGEDPDDMDEIGAINVGQIKEQRP